MADPIDNLADRLFRDTLAALELFTVQLGERRGLYRAPHEGGPATSTELAARTGTAQRYVREAGFGSVEVPPIETAAWRLYRLHP